MELRERKPPSLKEKLSDHYQKRDFTVKEKDLNQIGVSFFWIMWISLLVEGQILTYILYGDDILVTCFVFIVIWFLAWQSFINWMGTYFVEVSQVDSTIKEKHHPGTVETPAGWYNCPSCQVS